MSKSAHWIMVLAFVVFLCPHSLADEPNKGEIEGAQQSESLDRFIDSGKLVNPLSIEKLGHRLVIWWDGSDETKELYDAIGQDVLTRLRDPDVIQGLEEDSKSADRVRKATGLTGAVHTTLVAFAQDEELVDSWCKSYDADELLAVSRRLGEISFESRTNLKNHDALEFSKELENVEIVEHSSDGNAPAGRKDAGRDRDAVASKGQKPITELQCEERANRIQELAIGYRSCRGELLEPLEEVQLTIHWGLSLGSGSEFSANANAQTTDDRIRKYVGCLVDEFLD